MKDFKIVKLNIDDFDTTEEYDRALIEQERIKKILLNLDITDSCVAKQLYEGFNEHPEIFRSIIGKEFIQILKENSSNENILVKNFDNEQIENIHNNNYVFISYSSKNKSIADSVRMLLIKNHISCWMAPYDIPAGSKYAYVINDALEHCSCLLLLLTNASQKSQFVEREVERAITYNKVIIPMQLEDLELNSGFKFYIGGNQIIPVSEIQEDDLGFIRILSGIKNCYNSQETIILHNNTNDVDLYLKTGVYLLGSDPKKCDILIQDYNISRLHAIISVNNNKVFIRDLNTTNGIFINGTLIKTNYEQIINFNDTITIGTTKLKLLEASSNLI